MSFRRKARRIGDQDHSCAHAINAAQSTLRSLPALNSLTHCQKEMGKEPPFLTLLFLREIVNLPYEAVNDNTGGVHHKNL